MGSSVDNRTPTGESLDQRLDALVEQYTAENHKSAAYHQRSRKVIPGGTTRSVFSTDPFPLTLSGGQGCFVTSVDGREYLDFVSEYNAGIYGHSHPAILDAIDRAAKGGFNLGDPNEREVELAEKLVSRFPSMDTIRFCNSGTEANTMAIATALHSTKRKKIMVFERGYHGGTLMFAGTNPLNLPHDFVMGVYNDAETTRARLTPDIGAVLVEPMLGAGGMIPATPAFLQMLRAEATRIGAVLIFDEIITSRLFYGGLQEQLGITPDMTTIGKHFGGGFSFGAFGGRSDIMALFDPRATNEPLHHSGTWNNNMFSMTAGCVGADLLSRAELERTAELGRRLRQGVAGAFARRGDAIVRVTGVSNVAGFAFLGHDGPRIRASFYFFMLRRGIHVARRGFASLNIMHQQEHVDRLVAAVEEFCRDVL
ncbi:Beta-phenylalanine transaminase like protein [Verticillium longisporum]|nr:Beta-phenylalanine transaminase like protein [Verticillium longisporum]